MNEKLRKVVKNPVYFFHYLISKGEFKHLSDDTFLHLHFKYHLGYELDLTRPYTFNEKLQWLKIYDRNPLYTKLVDKFRVREYISNKIGSEHLVPIYGFWDKVEDIDFDKLPNEFVLKANHTSGDVFICKDKSKLDIEKLKKTLNRWLKRNYFWKFREWPYKNVKPMIIAEKYLKEFEDGVVDYKLMCFNGEVVCTFVCTKRNSPQGLHITIVDKEWNTLPVKRTNTPYEKGIIKPINYDKMISYAEKLSEEIPFVRVDLYEIDGQIYFGELTFYPASGFDGFEPNNWDIKFGEQLDLKKHNFNLN